MSKGQMAGREQGGRDVVVEISYCPCLGTYHYKRSDGEEYFWDNDKLEQTLTYYLTQGKARDAEFMARLTTAARETPHKVLVFDGAGKCEVREPVVPAWVAELASEGGK
jgi:hypothetical protein